MGRKKGLKFDNDKPRWDLLPLSELSGVVDVLTHGAKKYGDHNWKLVKNAEARYFAAAMRHLAAYQSGERVDESGCQTLDHVICSLLFLSHFDKKQTPVVADDIPDSTQEEVQEEEVVAAKPDTPDDTDGI